MDYADHYNATKDAIIDALATVKRSPPTMMAVEAFDAEDDGGLPVRVIGVVEDEDMLKFIVIETDEDGAIFPIVRTTIYRKGGTV